MKKVEVYFLLVVAYLMITTACKKQNIDTVSTDTDTDEKVHVKLTGAEQEMLAEILRTEGVKDATDFKNKVSYVKAKSIDQSAVQSTTIATVTNTDYYESNEEIAIGDFYTAGLTEINEFDYDYTLMANLLPQYGNTGIRVFKGVGQQYTVFSTRGNQIMLNVPYTVAMNNSSMPSIIKVAAMPSAPPGMLPVGPYWGTYSSSAYPAYVQSFGKNSASVHAEGTEVRSIVYSSQGKVKVTTETDLKVLKAGVEMEAGFTIESASNIYNQYTLQGTFAVQLLHPGGPNDLPLFNFASSLKALQYGILRNQ